MLPGRVPGHSPTRRQPRLHPFCPVLAGGRLLAAIPRSSPKGNDLRRERSEEGPLAGGQFGAVGGGVRERQPDERSQITVVDKRVRRGGQA